MAKSTKTADDDRPAGGTERGEAAAYAADDLKTEQEKGGKDPVGEAEEPKGLDKLNVVKVGAREPYPGGKEPDPEEQFKAAHGFKRAKE